jgi:threonine dehydrogenase-like Zn-dependent dehydrogenase
MSGCRQWRPGEYFVQKEIDIRGSRNALPEDFRAVMAYLKRGRLSDRRGDQRHLPARTGAGSPR